MKTIHISGKEYWRILMWLVVIAVVSMVGCDKKPVGVEIIQNVIFPNPPTHLRAVVSDGQVRIMWDVLQPDSVKMYYIYRSENTPDAYVKLDSTTQRAYVDTLVQNGLTYYYQVSVVNKEGFESVKSAPISALPSVFAIAIENGAEFTSSRVVNIVVNAPSNAALVMLGNDSLFTSSAWEAVNNRMSWTLTAGDGLKTVYAKFRFRNGVESEPPVRDTIILDTNAVIRAVRENTNGQPKRAGEIIHFEVDAGEPDGLATISIIGGPQKLRLFDNGTNGDKTPQDGVYELDFVIPDEIDVYKAGLVANFLDRVGNRANEAFAETRITILKPPESVTMFEPILTADGTTSLRLSWTLSPDKHDFANYSIYKSKQPNVTDTTGTLVGIVNNRTTTDFVVQGLEPGTTYYFRVYVTDLTGLKSASNIVVGTTSTDDPPRAVTVFEPLLAGKNNVQLTWTQSVDNDFSSYRVFRATQPGVTQSSKLRSIILRQTQTAFTDSGFVAGETYYYRVFVFDINGFSTGSNEVSITIPQDTPPEPVVLAQPVVIDSTRLRLSWSQNNDDDFAYYALYRSTTSPVDTTAAPAVILSGDRRRTEYTDVSLTPRQVYYYRVFVVDKSGLRTGSNEVSGKPQ
ncbi:MAG: fibronectin type III domain-containing protein [candidate division KSB1 bacterium]|nr:fibronectin type III domain-containing protein [candidate division KSB1 bacterium]